MSPEVQGSDRRQYTSLQGHIPEAAGIALALVMALAVWLGARYVEQADWVRHTLEVQTRIFQVWSAMQDVETGQRSYILTGDERFLEPYTAAVSRIRADMESLADVLSDNPRQLAALGEIRTRIAQRLAFASETVELRRQGDFERARLSVLDGHGLSLMRELRERFEQMQRAEGALLDERSSEAEATITYLSGAIFLVVLGAAGAFGAWVVNARRIADELATANGALENSIAERDAAEQQVRQMQKMDAVGQLAGGIAHDFNNMLAVIMAGVTLARKRISTDAAAADGFLASALEGAQRASTLIQRLLAFSRQQPLAPEAIDANKFVSGMSELISRSLGESIRMETVLGGGLWTTFADSAQLEAAVLNLCVNARDAMPNGGRLTLETANCHLDDRYARLHPGVPPGQYVLIAVSDTGAGMSKDVIAKAFDPFFTTKDTGKGTGLGLSQVFGFVKQSGGHVKIYSEIGQGTTVKIYLPRHYESSAVRSAATRPGAELRGTETILVVEDDASVLALTAAGLRDLGYNVLEATHATDGLRRLVDSEQVDLLLTDIVMPDINGRKLADQAVMLVPGLKVLFMTGFTKNAIVHNGALDPGVHFLAKPFTLEELSHKVREVLDTTVQG